MLLPSPIPCNTHVASQKPVRPKVTSSIPYQPLSTRSSLSSLVASCRALQAILGSVPTTCLTQSAQTPTRQSLLLHDIWPDSQETKVVTKRGPAKPSRGSNKRRRAEDEDEDENQSQGQELEGEEKENLYSVYATPKRQRMVPLLIPLGLSVEDFNALEDSSKQQLEHRIRINLPKNEAGSNIDDIFDGGEADWTVDDDRMLVETMLEKLKLPKREWNDCARRLGKDKDSLGRRWNMLVVEGNVGLRRGGRTTRPDLDARSW